MRYYGMIIISFARFIVSKVSVKVPIWLSLIKMELAAFNSMPLTSLFLLVTNKSSPL